MPQYITREGFDTIQQEIHHLWHVERPEIVDSVHEAASLGDRSENAAYIYGKRRLREIDSRMRYLKRKIDGVVVVDLSDMPAHPDVRFGCQVTVETDEGETRVYRLVDKVESDAKRGRISVQSPIGRALLGKRVEDYVEITLPKGVVGLEITQIFYGVGEP